MPATCFPSTPKCRRSAASCSQCRPPPSSGQKLRFWTFPESSGSTRGISRSLSQRVLTPSFIQMLALDHLKLPTGQPDRQTLATLTRVSKMFNAAISPVLYYGFRCDLTAARNPLATLSRNLSFTTGLGLLPHATAECYSLKDIADTRAARVADDSPRSGSNPLAFPNLRGLELGLDQHSSCVGLSCGVVAFMQPRILALVGVDAELARVFDQLLVHEGLFAEVQVLGITMRPGSFGLLDRVVQAVSKWYAPRLRSVSISVSIGEDEAVDVERFAAACRRIDWLLESTTGLEVRVGLFRDGTPTCSFASECSDPGLDGEFEFTRGSEHRLLDQVWHGILQSSPRRRAYLFDRRWGSPWSPSSVDKAPRQPSRGDRQMSLDDYATSLVDTKSSPSENSSNMSTDYSSSWGAM